MLSVLSRPLSRPCHLSPCPSSPSASRPSSRPLSSRPGRETRPYYPQEVLRVDKPTRHILLLHLGRAFSLGGWINTSRLLIDSDPGDWQLAECLAWWPQVGFAVKLCDDNANNYNGDDKDNDNSNINKNKRTGMKGGEEHSASTSKKR